MLQADRRAGQVGRMQCRRHGPARFARIVIANPGFEQVAKDVKPFHGAGRRAHDPHKRVHCGRRGVIQMKIGDKQRSHRSAA